MIGLKNSFVRHLIERLVRSASPVDGDQWGNSDNSVRKPMTPGADAARLRSPQPGLDTPHSQGRWANFR